MSIRYRPGRFTTDAEQAQATLVLPADPEHPISADSEGEDICMSSGQVCDFETPLIDPEWLASRGPSRVEVL
jgi:hypothetical protein